MAGARIVPRATQDVALSWAVTEIWPLVDRHLKESILLRDVDPDRVYLMGYSMGGWGTLLMAPAMADRFAAAAASAGGEHAPRAHPENLRNTPLRIQIGTEDHPFQRYALSKAYGEALRALRDAEPAAYVHEYREHAGKGHAIVDSDNPKWLSGFVRRPWPEKVVWRPVGPACGHVRTFYYLALAAPAENMTLVVARDGNTFTVEKAEGVEVFSLLLSDDFADLDEPVVVRRGDRVLAEGKVERRLRTLFESLAARGDRRQAYPARLSVRP